MTCFLKTIKIEKRDKLNKSNSMLDNLKVAKRDREKSIDGIDNIVSRKNNKLSCKRTSKHT